MGLDMYLSASRYLSGWNHTPEAEKETFAAALTCAGLSIEDISGRAPSGEISLNVGYWHKANAIHAWFVKHAQQGNDDCLSHYVSRDQLKNLLRDCQIVKADHSAAELLPPQKGFFFGSTEIDDGYFQDIEDTIEVIERCLGKKFEAFDFEYRSSW